MISDELIDKTLEKINKTTAAHDYFFNNINNPSWLLPLKDKGFFSEPTPAIKENGYIRFPSWPESGYLVRVADRAEDDVLAIIRSLPDTDNERVMDDIVNILLKVDPAKAVKQTELVKKYVNSSRFLLLHKAASSFICKLADAGHVRAALSLAREMLEVMPDPEKDEKLKSDYVMIKPTTKYRDHDYSDIVESITLSLVSAAPFETINMYAELLNDAIDYELTFFKEEGERASLEKKDDFSFISRPNIAENKEYGEEPDDSLTTALRDSVVALVARADIADIEKLGKLKELAEKKYSIFKRIVEFSLRGHENDEVYSQFYSSLTNDEKLKIILDSEAKGLHKITTGLVTEKPTSVLHSLSNHDLLKTLRDYEDTSGWSFERDSVAKELNQLIQQDVKRFIPLIKDIALIKNEYLNELVQAFEEVADSIDENDINALLDELSIIYLDGNKNKQDERHDYFSWSKSASLRFIEKILTRRENKTERITEANLPSIIELTLLLCRDADPSSDNNSNLASVELSVNSIRGNAVHTLVYLLAWMNRNKTDKAVYASIFKELDWHLIVDNDSAPAIRAVYGWRFEILYGTDQDWAIRNTDKIFSDDDLGRAAFDAYVMFNRVHPEALQILRKVFHKQLNRLSVAPEDEVKMRHDGLKNFTQHIALHYWYGEMDLNEDSLMGVFLSTAETGYIKELVNFVGFRLYKNTEDNIKKSHIDKLLRLWESIVQLTEDDRVKNEVLGEFGGWFASGIFDDQWSLSQLAYAASKAGDINLDFAALERLKSLVKKYPAEALYALSAMIDGSKEHWAISGWSEDATEIIQSAYSSSNSEAKQSAAALANKLVAKGYIEYRNILNSASL